MGSEYAVLEAGCRRPYAGTAHERLLEKINGVEIGSSYMNCCEVLQSSGMGKSRTVHELANLVFTLPINVGAPEGKLFPVYPPPDKSLRRYLVEEAPDDKDECFWHYMLFFSHLFYFILEELEQLSIVTSQKLSRGELASVWREHLNDQENRDRIYAEVVGVCNELRFDLRMAESTASSWLSGLLEKIDSFCVADDTQKIKIVIYIDEAQELKVPYKQDNNPDGLTRLDTLCSVLHLFREKPLFFLLISTQLLLRRG